MVNRALTLLLSCLFAHLFVLGCGSALGAILSGVFGLIPERLYDAFPRALDAFLLGAAAALEYAAVGLLFSLWAPVRWREAAVWTWAGVTLLQAASLGRGFFGSPWVLALELVVGGAAAAGVCWFVDREAEEPWVHKAHELLDAFTPR